MAPIAACIHKLSRGERLGIGLINSVRGAPVTISSIAEGSLFASSGLAVGMQVLSINNIPLDGATSSQAIQLLKDAEGQVVVVADNPVQAAVVITDDAIMAPPSAPTADEPIRSPIFDPRPAPPSIAPGRKRGYIILKKTFKCKAYQVSTEKSYSFHGPMTPDMVTYVNEKLQTLRLAPHASRLQFTMNKFGHFQGMMNHNAQKYNEEDFVVVVLEAMEELGYYFRFQYDAETYSDRATGGSYTSKELFIFHKMQE